MDFYTTTPRVVIRLDEDERFIYVPERYFANDATPSIRVTEIEFQGDYARAKGQLVRVDGTVGTAVREITIDFDRLPVGVLVKLCRYLLNPLDTSNVKV